MYFDRIDIVEAYYLYFIDYHGGQWSREYARLSKMLRYFTPRLALTWDNISENAQAIYNNLVIKHHDG